MTSATQEAIYLRLLLKDMGIPQTEPTIIHCDNRYAMDLVLKQGNYQTTRHINNRISWLNTQVTNR